MPFEAKAAFLIISHLSNACNPGQKPWVRDNSWADKHSRSRRQIAKREYVSKAEEIKALREREMVF
jgi:hypothetical protein